MAKKIKKSTTSVNVLEHVLVPKLEVVPQSKVDQILKEYQLTSLKQFPAASSNDPAVLAVNAKSGDLVKINREEPTGKAVYYRLVQ